ncbi:glycosyltransferase [Streptomyces phage Zuko]|uniref:Glycosyltransferase n=1 Tax=Streptomyces phage Zuko TaxID=2601695 RepID=A0A5J6D789_9CAUD|nr:glycosyltransferase [Streptomyces phage Zuko]QEQ93684.1 glycosyltransferase [Streptomyces phage Zuko]
MTPAVTVVVPFHTHREKNGFLQRAIRSIEAQTLPDVQVIAVRDELGRGAAETRHAGLMLVDTPWVAFLDSDDEMDPHHLEALLTAAEHHSADYVYPWFRVRGGQDPFPQFFGKPWDNTQPHQTTVTTLVRTDLAKAVGFKPPAEEGTFPDGNRAGEDWHFTLGCMDQGAMIYHHPEITWTWHHHGANTSGQPGRGDAR